MAKVGYGKTKQGVVVYLLLLVIVITVLFPIMSCYVMAHAAYGFVWFFVFGMRPHCCVSLILYCMHSAL